MLTEFVFTPSVLDENAHDDKEAWLEQLRDLSATMFPKTSACPVVVSNLYSESWYTHVVSVVKSIGDDRARRACQQWLTAVSKVLVNRPAIGDWPGENDAAWCYEALGSDSVEPIERIVSTRSTKNSAAETFSAVRGLDEVSDSGFWKDVRSGISAPMTLHRQTELLRKVCLHSQWLAWINPYGLSSEDEFTLALIELAFRRPTSFGPLDVEIHTRRPEANDEGELNEMIRKKCRHFADKIPPIARKGEHVRVHFWSAPSLRDRRLLAGTYARTSDCHKRKSPRWGISMQHVARRNDPEVDFTDWHLLHSSPLDHVFRKFVAESANEKPASIVLS